MVQAIEAERRELEARLQNYYKEKEAFDLVSREMEQAQLIAQMEMYDSLRDLVTDFSIINISLNLPLILFRDSPDHKSKTSSASSFKNLKYWKKWSCTHIFTYILIKHDHRKLDSSTSA